MDAGTLAFHILSVGLNPTQATRFLNHLGIKCYNISTVYSSMELGNIAILIESVNYKVITAKALTKDYRSW